MARTEEPPSLLWQRTDWFAGLSWRDELPWPTATTGGMVPRSFEAPAAPATET